MTHYAIAPHKRSKFVCIHIHINVLLTEQQHIMIHLEESSLECGLLRNWQRRRRQEKKAHFHRCVWSERRRVKNFITHSYCGIMNSFSDCSLLLCYYCMLESNADDVYERDIQSLFSIPPRLQASNTTTWHNIRPFRWSEELCTNLHVTIICSWQHYNLWK